MLRKSPKKINLKEQKRIYNQYILEDDKFKRETIIVALATLIAFLAMNQVTMVRYLLISFMICIYISYTFKNSLKWYEKTKANPLKKEHKLFKGKPYDLLTKDEKMKVLQEYKKSSEYNPFLNIIYIVLFFEMILLFLKQAIGLNEILVGLLLSLVYLIYDLVKMKKWYKNL